MRPTSSKDLSVYDFDPAVEAVDTFSEKFKSRLGSKRPKPSSEAIDKYTFLQSFVDYAIDRTDAVNASCFDSPEGDDAQASCPVEERSELDENLVKEEEEEEEEDEEDDDDEEADYVGTQIDVISDDDEESSATESDTPSPYTSPLLEEDGLLESPNLFYTAPPGEEYDSDMADVRVLPDYILYGNTLYWESRLIFSENCIRIEYSESSDAGDGTVLEWPIADIVCIDSQWSQCAEVANVHLLCRSTTAAEKEKMLDGSDAVKVMFSVTGVQWPGKEQKIISLADRYKDIWRVRRDDHVELDDVTEDPTMFMPVEYFNTIEEPFEDVIYPKGNPNAISVSRMDLDLLDPGVFINDTIIDFYIEYLKSKIQPSERRRFHFFNSFFFRKLADLDKDPGSALDGKAAFQRVRKWTRKVNMFDCDYIFIPVNFSFHWSLLVLCHPGDIPTIREDGIKKSDRVPCILHMNSIKGTHPGLEILMQCYLHEEWKERHPENGDFLSRFSNLKFVSLDLPQQENSFDCGLFLLHYVESFLKDAPNNFSPFSITKFSVFLTENWFVPAEASHKRSVIRKMIYDLIGVPSRRLPTATPRSSNHSLGNTIKSLEQETFTDIPSENCSTAKLVSATESRIEIKLLTASPPPGISECDKQGMILQDLLTPRATAQYSTASKDYPFQSSEPSAKLNYERCPADNHADVSTLAVSTNLDKEDHQPLDGELTTQFCSSLQREPVNQSGISIGGYETSWMSLEMDVDMNCSSKSLTSDHLVSDSKDEALPPFLYVSDTPAASYQEKLRSCFQYSQEIDAIKAEGDCEGYEGGDITMEDYGGVEGCQEKSDIEIEIVRIENFQNTSGMAGVVHVEDCQNVIDCRNAVGANSEGFKLDNASGRDHRENDTNKVTRENGENDTNKVTRETGGNDTDSADKANCEDTQEIGTQEGGRNGEVQKLDTADVGIGGTNDPCSNNAPSQSFDTNKITRETVGNDADKVTREKGENDTNKVVAESGGNDTDSADKANCDYTQEISSQEGGGNGEVQKLDTADVGIGGTTDPCSDNAHSQSFDTNKITKETGGNDADKVTREKGENDTNKVTRETGGNDTYSADNANCEDTQEIGAQEGCGNGEVWKLDTADVGLGGTNDPRSNNVPSQSFDDAASSGDESSLDKDVWMKRDEPGARVEQKQRKRRKLMIHEGGKR